MVQEIRSNSHSSYLLSILKRKLRRICSRSRWCLVWRRPGSKVIIERFGKSNTKLQADREHSSKKQTLLGYSNPKIPIRVATFNVAMFSLAPAISKDEELALFNHEKEGYVALRSPIEMKSQDKAANYCPKSILSRSPLHTSLSSTDHLSKQKKLSRSKLKVSINLPDNEISLANSNVLMRSPVCLPTSMMTWMEESSKSSRSIADVLREVDADISSENSRSIAEVLREVDADILALQDVKAVEENDMKPLSDLAASLGMKYVFADSWAPEYGNAILSKWPIKRWRVQKIADDKDFRNVLKATIDVPWAGEVNVDCTQLDHLNENWRMKQITAIIQSNDSPHLLAGGLNSLDRTDYSAERWMDIVKYYEDMGKPTPKVEVMKLLKGIEYVDSKDFAGECDPVVIIAKGPNAQGTCKYGSRVDYILASPDSSYMFVPGSYSVISSKGTSDHHIVKVDVTKESVHTIRQLRKPKQKIVRMINPCSIVGIWKMNTEIPRKYFHMN